MDGVDVEGNERLEFLPINLGEKFPNLIGLHARRCSIEVVTKENFRGLNKLKWLYLPNNQIEKIDDDTFEYIPVVEAIHLGFNKIRQLNSRAFTSLSKLIGVFLEGNVCINVTFAGSAARLAEMPREVDLWCSFEEPKGGPCEEINNSNGGSLGILKTCFMETTAIDSKDFSITSARDETVKGFHAERNANLEFLPTNFDDKLPNLIGLSASHCTIKEISNENFEGLKKLRALWLGFNQIEKIDDDTFDGIPAVEFIGLKGNKIKELNSRAFIALSKLSSVFLNGNDCIDEKFVNATRIAEMPLAVDLKCGLVKKLKATSAGGPCEKIQNLEYGPMGSLKSCYMGSNVINSTDFLITSARDWTVEGFNAERNKKLEYLPKNLGKKFPIILVLSAYGCSIKEIRKENFKGLKKLRHLYLQNNQIEKIDDDTFEFIPTVGVIYLKRNKIKKLNGRAFISLKQLENVNLENNACINRWFDSAAKIPEMQQVVTSNCGFEPNGGACEEIRNTIWGTLGPLETCYMPTTVIESPEFLITSDRDEEVKGFNVYNNKKLEFWPSNLGDVFPNLVAMVVYECSIKEIRKANFRTLNKLRRLILGYNLLETIDDDTFDFIPEIEEMSLAGNKIKKLNSRAFASLSKLIHVQLESNDCIDEDFNGTARIVEMPNIVASKCGFEPKACGVPMKATGTIIGGDNFERGDFPWMVALYRRLKRKQQAYFCGGSVITDRHVLSAAHCLEGLVPDNITAVFGAYDLNDHYESGRFVQSPSRIFVHDDWNPGTGQFDADITMLLMPEKIVFSKFVQPICLWEPPAAPIASTGILPGWGQSQNISKFHETIPTMLELPIHTNADCFLKFYHLTEVSSNRTFCAGSADGRGPCKGDSGGGFYVYVGNVFYLRGIVSAAWDVNVYGQCLLEMYTIYTDVVKFNEWIDDKMRSN